MKKTVLALGSIAASFVAAAANQAPASTPQLEPLALVQAWTGTKPNSSNLLKNPVDLAAAHRIEEKIMVADSSTKCCSSGTCDIFWDIPDCEQPWTFPSTVYDAICTP